MHHLSREELFALRDAIVRQLGDGGETLREVYRVVESAVVNGWAVQVAALDPNED